jgi:putative FmdB family regulatory protein
MRRGLRTRAAIPPLYTFTFRIKGLAMPIYAYRCDRCGHAKDVLQKVSDPVLSTCPACGEAAFRKQVTAAGFQLKGSGWYVTDFRGGNGTKTDAKPSDGGKTDAGNTNAGKTDAGKTDAADSAAKPAAAASSSDGASAGGCGTSCGCH